MSNKVLKRTCFYSIVDGKIRPHEWAQVIYAGLGTMVEPFWPFQSTWASPGNKHYTYDDFTSDNQRVDEFVEVDDNKFPGMLSSDGKVIHGGHHWPRTGR